MLAVIGDLAFGERWRTLAPLNSAVTRRVWRALDSGAFREALELPAGRTVARLEADRLFGEDEEAPPAPATPSRHPWPWLLMRVFAVDVSVCPVAGCGGVMRVLDIAAAPDHAASVLTELGLAPRGRPPPRPYPIPARQLALPI